MVLDLVIVGAGPYGLSLSAYAKTNGINHEIIGYPMEFWYKKMPPKMFIRTKLKNTGIADSKNILTLEKFSKEMGITLEYPLPRTTFVEYGFWFIEKTGIRVTMDYVVSILKNEEVFQIQTLKGRTMYSRNIVIAVGLTNAKYIPENLMHLPCSLVSHTSDHVDFHTFQGKQVLVLGGGQSAWEAAALLNEAAAEVKLIYRRPNRLIPDSNTNEKQEYYADKFYFLEEDEKEKIRKELRKPTVSEFLVPLVEGKVQQIPNTVIMKACQTEDGRIKVIYQEDKEIVDHIIAATGFKYSLSKLPFLSYILPRIVLEVDGSPKVNEHFQSSVLGLYFAGPATAYSHGPTFSFIAGVGHTSKTLVSSIIK